MDQATHNKIVSFIWGIADDVLRDLFRRGKYPDVIATYVWVLSNRKPVHRKGRVQLIDASQWFKPLRKNLGKKNCELSPDDIDRISRTFLDFKETPESKIFPNAAFGYWKVTVERPLRLHSQLSLKAIETLRFASGHEDVRAVLYEEFGDDLFKDFAGIATAVEQRLADWGADDESEDEEGDDDTKPKKGLPEKKRKKLLDGKTWERDGRLIDAAMPLLEEGGIEAFIRREVLPYTPDAWVKNDATKIGYEISFTRHFYKPQPLRTLEEISADILAIEKEAEGLLDDLLKVGAK